MELTRSLAPRPIQQISTAAERRRELSSPSHFSAQRRKPASRLSSARNGFSSCTKSGHPPVDDLHSIENKSDRSAIFLLTPKLERVQKESFFDSFKSFSSWCGVRGSS